MEVSRWLSLQVWLSLDEMRVLFEQVLPCRGVYSGRVLNPESTSCSVEMFLNTYSDYLEAQKVRGDITNFRQHLAVSWTRDDTSFEELYLREDAVILKPLKPVIQTQVHSFTLSEEGGKVHSMVLGPTALYWGVQFSYPQLFHSDKGPVSVFKEAESFPNTGLYRTLQKEIRKISSPVAFNFAGKKIQSSLRLGRGIEILPNLKEQGIEVLR